ncbi:MAG: hypothetical protein ACE362_21715 [Phaeodactylibacter xiamenensis]|uniref:Uncharacterized protein n=1 Tax=Phaeodactylibacter xiamenensis TaxID=1524460 RepID=A0A098S2H1_9BACT|nr:hypothetical protein [Phaeodactylibacter xiamenensis]KGE86286.1 hypothetical protein IX84_22265 [Phaeodactylibacter xiamenensis]MCR9052891.1 hypothetical protein [bacterium]
MGLFDRFKKKQPETMLDKVQEQAGALIINGFRRLAAANGTAPTAKTSDLKIIEIYKQVGSAFRKASKERNEHLPAGYLNTIVFKFFQVYEIMGDTMFYEHLKYEVARYIKEGLRDDYKQDLKLF